MVRQEVANIAQIITDPDAYGSVLLVALVDEWGTEWFSWEPDTLLMEIDAKWKVKPPTVNRDKIWSLVSCLTSNMYWKSLEVFIQTAHALNSHPSNFEVFSPANISEISWSLAEVLLVAPPDPKEDEMDPEISEYIRLQLEEEAFNKPPRILAKYVKMRDNAETAVSTDLDPDGVDETAFWKDQEMKRLDVEEYVKKRMTGLLETIAAMPLRAADRAAVQELLQRAQTTLAGQSRQTQSAMDSVRPKIIL